MLYEFNIKYICIENPSLFSLLPFAMSLPKEEGEEGKESQFAIPRIGIHESSRTQQAKDKLSFLKKKKKP